MLVSLFYLGSGFPGYTGEALGCEPFKGTWLGLGSYMAWCLVGLAWTSGPITLLISTNINVKKETNLSNNLLLKIASSHSIWFDYGFPFCLKYLLILKSFIHCIM